METNQVRETLKSWISLDDEERTLRQQIAIIKQKKASLSSSILEFMRNNEVDNFSLEGNGAGNISRSVRTSRPPLKRAQLRTQLLLHFAEQPQKVAEFLRQIEGVPDNSDNMSTGGTQKELLVRRIPKKTMDL
jgi:DnaJ-domain-containing protein 1